MNAEVRAHAETKIQAYWTRLLDEALHDARAEKVQSETLPLFAEGMVHVGLARMAALEGAGRIATQLRMIADKFAQTAVHEGKLGH